MIKVAQGINKTIEQRSQETKFTNPISRVDVGKTFGTIPVSLTSYRIMENFSPTLTALIQLQQNLIEQTPTMTNNHIIS